MATAQMLLKQTFAQQVEKVKNDTGIELPKYYNPAAMNPLRYANQIQKRKLLWGNKGKEAETSSAPEAPVNEPNKSSVSSNKWQGTKFAQDTDGKVASKFMRLMGIKDPNVAQGSSSSSSAGDIVKKQEEMFEAMQAQYEVARATTHTMRGVGLGFSSHAKPF
ncbi:arginine/serine-rich coiled-coil protein 2-like [Arctopsyche grandis]|uniref:arginine/serine-rich coiled-coil protein 2-like n=1 Tax=Arctopsyche grandis TaxID=121162 RepID=UPI00406D6737